MAGFPLEVTLSATLDQFERQMAQAGQIADDAVGKINDSFSKANPTLGGLSAGGLAGILGAVGLGGIIEAAVKANSSLADLVKTAKELGLELDRLQSIQFAGAISGLDSTKVNDGLAKMASLISDAQEHENSLSKLYDANGLKITDNNGKLIDTNKILDNAISLISRARSEQDKIDFAKMLGLTKEWVPLLEQGKTAFEQTAAAAQAAGAIIDENTVRKAKEFDDEWKKASVSWAANMKAAVAEVLGPLNDLIALALSFAGILGRFTGLVIRTGKEAFSGGAENLQLPDLEAKLKDLEAQKDTAAKIPTTSFKSLFGVDIPDRDFDTEIAKVKELIDLRKIAADATGRLEVRPSSTTDTGGTNRPPADAAGKDAFDRAEDQLKKRAALFDAEAASVGRSTFETARNRAEAELLTAAERAGLEVTAPLKEKIDALANSYALAADKAKQAQLAFAGINSAAQFFGNQLSTALDGVLNKTTTWQQAFTTALRAVQSELIKAAITGQGAFAQILGAATPVPGGTGGLFGGILSLLGVQGARAGGGSVSAGVPYLVGENGPERFVPNQSGMIVPNGMWSGGGGPSVTIMQNIDLSSGITGADQAFISQQLERSKRETVVATIAAIKSGNRADSSFLNR